MCDTEVTARRRFITGDASMRYAHEIATTPVLISSNGKATSSLVIEV